MEAHSLQPADLMKVCSRLFSLRAAGKSCCQERMESGSGYWLLVDSTISRLWSMMEVTVVVDFPLSIGFLEAMFPLSLC